MKKLLWIIPILGATTLSSCCSVNEAMCAMQRNTEAIEWSTVVICENAQAIDEANKRIEENRREIEAVNKRLQEMSKS